MGIKRRNVILEELNLEEFLINPTSSHNPNGASDVSMREYMTRGGSDVDWRLARDLIKVEVWENKN